MKTPAYRGMRMRATRQFWPVGQIIRIFGNRVKPQNQKYFCFSETKSGVWSARLTRQEGRLAIVTNVRWDAMDAKVTTDERGLSVRQNRVVLTPRCWRQVGGAIRE